MITQHSWMFLSSYEKLRENQVLKTHWIKKQYHAYHYGTKVLDNLLGIKTFDFGLGSAGAIVMTVIVLILSSFYIKRAIK